ncbi:MAG: hypothetical protein ACM3JC_04425 [Rudaea sp.]
MNAPRVHADVPAWLANAALLALCAVVAAWAALRAGQDANWDLQNYHFYDPWAWLTGRIFDWDIAAAQLQTFHSPFADIPFYALVAAHVNPRIVTLWLALPTAVAAFFVAKIAWRLFADLAWASRVGATLAALAIGFTGATGRGQLGSTTGEWLVAAPTLFALWLLLPGRVQGRPASAATLFAAGAVAGIASGLKLTAATYALALLVAVLAWPGPRASRLRAAVVYGGGALAGLALALGPWCAQLWSHFGNPLFPYGNEWVRSPWWDAAPVLPRRFGPHTLRDALLFPFELLAPAPGFVSELRYVDARIPLLFALALIVAAAAGVPAPRDPHPRPLPRFATTAAAWRFVGVFCAASFVVWAVVHAILRYTIPIEILSGVLIVGLLGYLFPARTAVAAIVVATLGLYATTRPSEWGRVDFGPAWFDVRVPPVEPNALVLLVVDAPMSYVLPYFPRDARHVGVRNNLIDPAQRNRLAATIAAIVREHRGPLYSLSFPAGAGDADLRAHRLQRVAGGCAGVVTNMPTSPIELCRLRRIP